MLPFFIFFFLELCPATRQNYGRYLVEGSSGCKTLGKHKNPTPNTELAATDYCCELTRNDSECGKTFFVGQGLVGKINITGKCICEKNGLDCTRRRIIGHINFQEYRLD